MILCKNFQVHPLRHKKVMPDIPFERQSLLVQEQLAALGGELDSLSTMGGGRPCLMYSDYYSIKAVSTRASWHV